MDSPGPSSPSNAGSSPVAGTWLSPRSKLNALLATVDTSDEEAGNSSNPVKDKRGSPAATSPTLNHSPRLASAQELDSSDEDAIVQPRGRVAARMQAKQNGEDMLNYQGQQDARERVRAMLNAEKDEQESAGPAPRFRPVQAGAEDSGEADITPRAHKSLARKERSKTVEEQISPQADSPGLFVSPAAEKVDHDSDDDLPAPSFKNARFQALVAKKREERQAREAEEERKIAARISAQQQQQVAFSEIVSGSESDRITDDEGGRKLTQGASRPAARKASRKALEEMNRETQRMTRQLQLAHEAKTRKKITKASLFERFNFRLAAEKSPEAKLMAGASSSRPTTPVSAHQTDIEMRDGETPPSSPPSALAPRVDEGKGKAVGMETNVVEAAAGKSTKARASLRVKLPEIVANHMMVESESDDELQITETKPDKVDAIFSRVPTIKAREPTAIRSLRRLAHLDSPERKVTTARKDDKYGMTAAELQISLQQRARLQAKLERDRRLELLKSKGIHVQTLEEKEREAAQVEDIVAAARKEAEDIMLREKEIARREKRERGENAEGEADPLAWDDSEDDDGEYKAPAEVSDIEISGSEDEADGDDEREKEDAAGSDEDADEDADADAEEEDGEIGGLIDNEAGSAEESTDEDAEDGFNDGDDEVADAEPTKLRVRENRRKTTTVISDDEDMPEVEKTPRPKTAVAISPAVNSDSPKVPTSVLRSATKAFIPGLPVPLAAPAGLGLTQIFAGTMDDSQADAASGVPDEPMPTFDNFPDSQFSIIATRENANDVIMDSQKETRSLDAQQDETQAVQLHVSQSQGPGFGSLLRRESTQLSDMIQATQDEGFHNYTPLKERFVEPPPSTVQTVVLEAVETATTQEVQETPVVPKRGRLRRRADMTQVSYDEDEADVSDAGEAELELEEDEFGFGTTDAFKKLQTAAVVEKKRLAAAEYDKKKSKAKDMVDEQAEESEDEYAGLGGVDGEDSDDSDAASVKEMIDDDSKDTDKNKAKLAAFYADGERARDEKQVEKLFKDITTGMLRHKRGADYGDLSDSDDGGEARRRMKRRQFAKMQRALFEDERIEKIAENPRNLAFLKSIEDRGSDDEMDFVMHSPVLLGMGTGLEGEPQQSESQLSAIPDSQPGQIGAMGPPPPVAARPRAASRRTKDRKRPANLGEIRESLSNLLEEPNDLIIPATEPSSDHSAAEDEAEGPDVDRESAQTGTSTSTNRRHGRRTAVAVVDRITLKRDASTSSNGSATGGSTLQRLAFATATTSQGPFKVPALLRRATTNSILSTTSSTSTTSDPNVSSGKENRAPGAGAGSSFREEGKIKRTAGKRSGVNYFARENERRAAVAESEKRRERKRLKGAEGRGKVVGSLFGGGRFE